MHKHCLSFDLLWRSIVASTDRAAIMSSLAGTRGSRQKELKSLSVWQNTRGLRLGKIYILDESRSIYFGLCRNSASCCETVWISLCLCLFSAVHLCCSSLLYSFFKVRLWMRDKMFDKKTCSCLGALTLFLLLPVSLSSPINATRSLPGIVIYPTTETPPTYCEGIFPRELNLGKGWGMGSAWSGK